MGRKERKAVICKIKQTKEIGFYKFTMEDSKYAGYFFEERTKKFNKIYNYGNMVVTENKFDSQETELYLRSSTFLQRELFLFFKHKLYKEKNYIGKEKVKKWEVTICLKNNDFYEISQHNNNMFSILKNNIQFALIKREEITWNTNFYNVIFDENIEQDISILILFVMYGSRFFVKQSTLDFTYGASFIDYKEERTKWNLNDYSELD